jgi:hypothetical protein
MIIYKDKSSGVKMKLTERQLRRIIRQELLYTIVEGRVEFHDDVKDINFNSEFSDPLFQRPDNKPYKKTVRDIKRSWNRNMGKLGDPNRDWIQSLTKVHWVYGFAFSLVQKINKALTADRRGEISAAMYEPGKTVTVLKDWSDLGLKIDGWVSLASKSMDTLMSGYIGDAVPDNPVAKKPRYPTTFNKHSPGTYVMGPKDYLFNEYSTNKNEAFVGNWEPIEWIIGPNFYSQIGAWDDEQEAQLILNKIKSTGLPVKDLEGNELDINLKLLLDYKKRAGTET